MRTRTLYQNETVQKINELKHQNPEKFKDLNQDAYSQAVDEWNPKEKVSKNIWKLEKNGNFDWLNFYWELQENMHGKIDFFKVLGLPDKAEQTELSKNEFKEVKDSLDDLMSIWINKIKEKIENEYLGDLK